MAHVPRSGGTCRSGNPAAHTQQFAPGRCRSCGRPIKVEMDEVRAFFNNPHPTSSQRIKLRGPLTGGHSISKHDTLDDFDRHKDHRHTMFNGGTDYVEEAKLKEMKLFSKNEEFDSRPDGLNALDQMSSLGSLLQSSLNLNDEVMTHVYNKYTFKRKEDTKNLIVRKLNAYPVIIIEGPTGCGKTTQVPQWILDDCYNNRRPCKIIVTQPRKIAAISISKRVAQERGWNVGGVVGYQIALENKTSSDTLIQYVTTGVLLQKLVNAKTMNEYTHVIIDEVHERGQEMDFLLIVVKRLLNTVSPKIKVVLMSATFNTGSFFDYFVPNVQPCVVNIRKERLRYSVKTFYLNNLKLSTDMHHLVVKLVNAFEYIDKTEEFEKDDISEEDLPSVLIFLPGINEIEDLYSCLTDVALRRKLVDADCAKLNWWVLPLHSTITADEQVRVFQRAPPGHRKIILSTNIAESSITVPDIKYVIDYCLMKVLEADPSTNFTALKLRWATKTNCEQRAGRAGRVGALKKLENDVADGELTNLGRIMATLPLDVRVANSPFRERLNAYNSKLTWADGSTSDCIAFLNVLIAGAFYPQYFVQVGGEEDRERDAVRTLGGLDPRTSVYLRGWPDHQPAEVYASTIKNIDPTIPGQVVLPIYKAIKARQLKMDIRIPLLPLEKANVLLAAMKSHKRHSNIDKLVPRLPDIDETHFPLKISQVFYIDYGSVGRVSGSSLRLLPEGCGSSPPLAMQCVLAELSPAPLLHPHGHWSSPALKMFTDLVQRGRLIGKVYSVTHGVVAVELMAEGGRISVNCELIAKGYAVRSEESYDSKMNHDLRETALEFNVAQRRAYNKEQTELAYSQICEVEAPSYKDCTSDALLKGPTRSTISDT
ncbi:unnamed protein product [Leptidea sinapis]|uniref:RNA helicase n=1 Tax=Leptidea sinapis TaxID=189913 RepID=A0A5E4QUB4_9NEOP|nr:unnamed protein product [Leptidea sinapis]